MDLFSPAILLVVFAYSLVVYMLMYMVASTSAVRASATRISFFQVKRTTLEFVGVVMRKHHKYITFNTEMDWFKIFKLNPNTASYSDVEQASMRFILRMHHLKWCYPESQRKVIRHLAAQGFKYIRAREIHEAAMEAIRRAQAFAGKQRYSSHARPSNFVSGWRTVLGVSASEQDVNVIKKAYRTRAFKAHPDRGGSSEAMAALNAAMAQARKELSFV